MWLQASLFLTAFSCASIVWFFSVSSCYWLIICSWGGAGPQATACAPPRVFQGRRETGVANRVQLWPIQPLSLPNSVDPTSQGNCKYLGSGLRILLCLCVSVLYVNRGGRRQTQRKKCLSSRLPFVAPVPLPPEATIFLPCKGTEEPATFPRLSRISSTRGSGMSCFCGIFRTEFRETVYTQHMHIQSVDSNYSLLSKLNSSSSTSLEVVEFYFTSLHLSISFSVSILIETNIPHQLYGWFHLFRNYLIL